MPWSDNNSGNKGGPTRGPWGQPPKSNGDGGQSGRGRGEPPDLEELLQASRQRLKRAFPRNRGGRGDGNGGGPVFQITSQLVGVVAFIMIVIWFVSGLYLIQPQEQGVTTTFGRYSGITGPGLHWRASMIQGVTKVSLGQDSEQIGGEGQSGQENLMLTSDRNIVDVSFTVDWKVSAAPPAEGERPNSAKFVFNVENPKGLVKAVAESAMRETIGSNRLDPIITSGQAQVGEQTRQRIQTMLDFYDTGIEVQRVNITKAQAPSAVRDAFVDVIRARSEQQQLINEAERTANQIVPVAQGDAQKIIQEARAYAARVVADSIGQAERFNKIYDEYRRAPQVTRQRMYIETVEKVLGDMNKVIIDESAGKGVVPYLPLNELGQKKN
jgi:membrane protease subunit HflK